MTNNNENKKEIIINQQNKIRYCAEVLRRRAERLEFHQKLYDEAVELYNESKQIKQYIIEDKI